MFGPSVPQVLNTTNSSRQGLSTTKADDNSSHDVAIQVVYGAIATFAFLLNSLFCVIIIKKPAMLKKPHNILLFTVAVADLLTAIFLPVTPGYVIDKSSFPFSHGLAGEIFCRVLGSRFVLFAVAKTSILLVTVLAIERWYCIFRPVKYKALFTLRRLILYIVAICVTSGLLQINKFFEWKLSGRECSSIKAPYGVEGTQAIIIIYCLIGFYIPCLVAWASFIHISLLLKRLPMSSYYGERQRAQQEVLLRMCGVTSIVLTLCWLPAQTIYILSPFGITTIGSPLHKAAGILAFVNSCVNPLIYWMTNKQYKDGLFELFRLRGNRVGLETFTLRELRASGRERPGNQMCLPRTT